MSTDSIYQTCRAQYDTSQLDNLLQCISEEQQKTVQTQTSDVASGLDSFYLIFAGALVFFMQTGFAMLCAGSIRAKTVKNVLLWNLLDSCGGGLAFWATGYALAYGGETSEPENTFVGNTNFFLMGDVRLEYWFFQFAFACAVSSIVAGAIAERAQMKAYLFYSFFLVGFAYPVVAHAFWSTNGFLANVNAEPLWGSGAIDFAGSGPVHFLGGVTSLVAAIILGPRMGRFYDRDGNPLEEPADIPGHSTALTMLGTFALWFGWYGFNPGSTFNISSQTLGEVAALVAVNTTLAACSGAVSALFTSTWLDWRATGVHTYDVAYTMNGCLTGLVAVTAPCAAVESWAAVLIGVVAGWVYLGASKLMVRLRIDDAVDACAVHMAGGAWGLIAAGLFSEPSLMEAAYGQSDHVGWFYEWGRGSGNFTLLGIQLLSILYILVWTGVIMGLYFYMLNYFNALRVDPMEEEAGMDVSRHKGPGYNTDATEEESVAAVEINKSRQQLFEDRSNSRHGSNNPYGHRSSKLAMSRDDGSHTGRDLESSGSDDK